MSTEAMKQALEALTTLDSGSSYKTHTAATALYRAIEQAEKQRPIGWWNGRETAWFEHESNGSVDDCTIPLYIIPPQREWVELTDEDIEEAWGEPVDLMYSKHYDAIRAIEAKLKEKNT